MGRCGMRKVTMESKWPWNVKPRVTPFYYKCTSCIMEKIRKPHAYPSLCVESLVCVFIFLIHHVCVSTWCLTWYQSGWLLTLLQIEWAICVYGLCIFAKILLIFAALRVSAANILPLSSVKYFLQHSEICFEKKKHSEIGSTGFEEEQHCASEGFLTAYFSCNFCILFCTILKRCWKIFSTVGLLENFLETLQSYYTFRKILLYIWRKKKNLLLFLVLCALLF